MVYETKIPRQHSASTVTEDCSDDSEVTLSDIPRFFFSIDAAVSNLHLF